MIGSLSHPEKMDRDLDTLRPHPNTRPPSACWPHNSRPWRITMYVWRGRWRSPVSCVSCTTNDLVHMVKTIHNEYYIEEALMMTAHTMTATQAVDGGGRRNQNQEGGAVGVGT